LLTSGKHSSGFFNSGLVMEDPSLIIDASVDLAGAVGEAMNTSPLNYVIGPALGAIVLAHCLAKALDGFTDRPCKASFTEKVVLASGTVGMELKRTQLKIAVDEVLVVEDVLTTGGSIEGTIEAVSQAGGHVAPVVAVLVNRSGLTEVRGGRKIVALIDQPMPMWSPEECPLCKKGSEAIRPKGADNWARLNASY
jgi:orotate phosphoribosyltransferase